MSVPADRPIRLVNLTHHPLDVGDGWTFARLESEGNARVESDMRMEERVIVDGITLPILGVTERSVTGLPDPIEGVLYVVSGIVAAAASGMGRRDVVSPGRVERSGDGKVKYARALVRIEKGREEWQGSEKR